MTTDKVKEKLIKNEVVFRHHNEAVTRSHKDLKDLAKATQQTDMNFDLNIPLHFYCECSDELCSKRIILDLQTYANIHKNRKRFVVIPSHEVPEVEKVVQRKGSYNIVEKYDPTPRDATKLEATPLNNT